MRLTRGTAIHHARASNESAEGLQTEKQQLAACTFGFGAPFLFEHTFCIQPYPARARIIGGSGGSSVRPESNSNNDQ